MTEPSHKEPQAPKDTVSRRAFIQTAGAAALSATMIGCSTGTSTHAPSLDPNAIPTDAMTMRTNPNTGDRVSLLGFGCMRFPTVDHTSARENANAPLDQALINDMVDFALDHGVNYFDTSPAYCQGRSEGAIGEALSRHPREKYFIATKLSNFAKETWPREASLAMYEKSRQLLRVDTIDYMLLHAIGMGAEDGLSAMDVFHKRYIENGILDTLVEEKKAGRIRNLGFSYHGDIAVFDELLKRHDNGQNHWDFVQIQLNYVDWKHAKEITERNTHAEYLYNELENRGIPAIIMEPLLGGRLASLNFKSIEQLKTLDPDASIASWAFRYAGSPANVLTVLSGMTFPEHLYENIRTYSPLKPITDAERRALEQVAQTILNYQLIQCNTCQYCMPCPYGLDIPAIFSHFNKCLNEDHFAADIRDPNYAQSRRAFLVGYDRAVPKLRQAVHCIACNKCVHHCPQGLDIPALMQRVDEYVEFLKQNPT